MGQDEKIKKNEYIEQLKKFVGQDVALLDTNGNTHQGKCLAINHQHLNAVVETEDSVVVSKGVCYLKRKK